MTSVHRTLLGFAERHPDKRMRVLSDGQLRGGEEALYLLQVDDYDIQVLVVRAPGGEIGLEEGVLGRVGQLLEDGLRSEAIILAWETEDLPSIPFNYTRIDYLRRNPIRLGTLLKQAVALDAALDMVLKGQSRVWHLEAADEEGMDGPPLDARRLFQTRWSAYVDAECRRAYRNLPRREAAEKFPLSREEALLMSALDGAFEGLSSGQIAAVLARLPGEASDDRPA